MIFLPFRGFFDIVKKTMTLTYVHSPFSPKIVNQAANPALLLQFILSELIKAEGYLVETEGSFSSPFEWRQPIGSLNKVKEHAKLLSYAFPHLEKEAKHFLESLYLPCNELIDLLYPFILAAKENVYLIYFLTKYRSHSAMSQLVSKIPKESTEKMQSVVATKYRKRGLSPPTWIY